MAVVRRPAHLKNTSDDMTRAAKAWCQSILTETTCTRRATMQITRSATSVSWIPSDSIPGLLKIPMEKGLMHYDPPPPLTVTNLECMRRRGEFRFANILRAWIHVEGGKIRDCGYAGGVIMGLTPITAGPLHVLLPTKANRVIQRSPQLTGDAVTFVQTAGGRPGFSFLAP